MDFSSVSSILQKNNLSEKYYKYTAKSLDTVFFMALPGIRRGQVIQAWTRKQLLIDLIHKWRSHL